MTLARKGWAETEIERLSQFLVSTFPTLRYSEGSAVDDAIGHIVALREWAPCPVCKHALREHARVSPGCTVPNCDCRETIRKV